MGVLAIGGWYLFLRKPSGPAITDAPPSTASAVTTPSTEPSVPPPSLAASPTESGPATLPGQPSAPTGRPAEPPPTGPRRGSPTGEPTPGRATAGGTTSRPAQGGTSPTTDMAFLDNEEPVETTDGRTAGEVAKGYRSDRGQQSGGSFGATGRLRARERNPRPAGLAELSAIKTLRYLMDNQEAFHRKSGRYGTFADLLGRTPLDVPHSADSFQRRGYRYGLEVTSDGYKMTAMPVQPGPRPFVGDDSGYIRPGLE